MQTIRASIASRFFGKAIGFPDLNDVPKVTVKTVDRCEYESSCKAMGLGEVISTLACTPNLAIADLIHVVSVEVKGVCVGKLHLRFYRELRKVKRNFIAFDTQVKKLIGGKRDRFALQMADWMGDATDVVIQSIASEACREVERLLAVRPTVTKRSERSESVRAVVRSVPTKAKTEKAVVFETTPSSRPVAKAAPGAGQESVKKTTLNRTPKGAVHRGVVTEMGVTTRAGQNGDYETFCLKLDVDGQHIPFYGVELQRESNERGVEVGQLVEVISQGKQALPGNRFKHLYHINIIRK